LTASSRRLEGRVAIVTGAGQGIGEAIARGYAREGAKVIITGRTMSKLADVAGKIRLCPPLLGSAGVLGFPHVTNCSAVWTFAQNQDGARKFLADLIDHSRTTYEKSAGCNFPIYQKTLPDLVVRLENDAHGEPPYKYKELKDALYWTRNLGFPGFANPVGMEAFNTFVIPRMFASVVTGRASPEDAAQAADAEVTRIADKWKQV